jgi:hypothetical protein
MAALVVEETIAAAAVLDESSETTVEDYAAEHVDILVVEDSDCCEQQVVSMSKIEIEVVE